MTRSNLLSSILAVGLLAAAAQSQLIISEVNFSKKAASGTQWIELLNLGTTDVALGGWSLYHATKTPNRVGDYWFGFPNKTVIASGAFLIIHWNAPIPTPSKPNQIFTGNSPYNFLFGHGMESLDPTQGAIAICKTKLNREVNNPDIFEDWVGWGDTGFPRENLAVNNKPTSLWKAGDKARAVTSEDSLAMIYTLNATTTPGSAFFQDRSPSMLAHNTYPAAHFNFGLGKNLPCVTGNIKPIEYGGSGLPIHGRLDYALVVKGTQGPAYQEFLLLLFNLSEGKGDPWGPNCIVVVPGGPTPQIRLGFMRTTAGETRIPIPLTFPGIKGLKIYSQAVMFRADYAYTMSRGLGIQFSNQ